MNSENSKNTMEPEVSDLSEFLDEFNSESDRWAALSAASIIDEWLMKVIQNFLADVKASDDILNWFNAPLGTFSARIKMTYALGLLEKREYEEIEIIRKVRNEFWHKWRDINFETEMIVTLCSKLPWGWPKELEAKATTRQRFNFAVLMLLMDLLWRSRVVAKERRSIKKWPSKSRQ
jgi:DNA-binding MltR family transcriptional regulator